MTQKNGLIADLIAELRQQKAMLETPKTDHASSSPEISAQRRIAVIEDLTDDLQQMHAIIAALRAAFQLEEKASGKLQTEAREKNAVVEELRMACKGKDCTISAHLTTLDEKMDVIQGLRNALRKKSDTISAHETVIREKKDDIEWLRGLLHRKNDSISALRVEVKRKEEANAMLQKEVSVTMSPTVSQSDILSFNAAVQLTRPSNSRRNPSEPTEMLSPKLLLKTQSLSIKA